MIQRYRRGWAALKGQLNKPADVWRLHDGPISELNAQSLCDLLEILCYFFPDEIYVPPDVAARTIECLRNVKIKHRQPNSFQKKLAMQVAAERAIRRKAELMDGGMQDLAAAIKAGEEAGYSFSHLMRYKKK